MTDQETAHRWALLAGAGATLAQAVAYFRRFWPAEEAHAEIIEEFPVIDYPELEEPAFQREVN